MEYARGTLLAFGLVATIVAATPAQERPPSLRVADRGRELVIEYGPVALPRGTSHDVMHQPPALVFPVPVDGWMRGYDVELLVPYRRTRTRRKLPRRAAVRA